MGSRAEQACRWWGLFGPYGTFGARVFCAGGLLVMGGMVGRCTGTDPNADYDPQAGQNMFCERELIASVPSRGRWVATAYRVNCDVLAKDEIVYVYLLAKGQITSRAGLVLRYEGDLNPSLTWSDEHTLIIKTGPVHGIEQTGCAAVRRCRLVARLNSVSRLRHWHAGCLEWWVAGGQPTLRGPGSGQPCPAG